MSAWGYLIFVLASQLGAIIWWGSNMSSRVRQIEKEQDKLSTEVDAINNLTVRLTVVESILGIQTEVLKEIRDEIKQRIYTIHQ